MSFSLCGRFGSLCSIRASVGAHSYRTLNPRAIAPAIFQTRGLTDQGTPKRSEKPLFKIRQALQQTVAGLTSENVSAASFFNFQDPKAGQSPFWPTNPPQDPRNVITRKRDRSKQWQDFLNSYEKTRILSQEEPDPNIGQPKLREQRIDDKGRSYGVGRRKTSTASVFVTPGTGVVTVNRKPLHEYFKSIAERDDVLFPMLISNTIGKVDVNCIVKGGGTSGQVGAVRLGLARALEAREPELRVTFRPYKLLTRDPRKVERKKYGHKKARKSFQWVSR
eukprot:GILK01006148.1.p1 GENE.GILK01006148.1~~GILK01006148.1.p1  ORF type:complete len:292 (-),score=30.67 GILK01006148.1:184-1017(-)